MQSSGDTLGAIERHIRSKKKGAYLRFGDGEIYILRNKGKSRNQSYSKQLADELEQAINLNDSGVFKSLAINSTKYGSESGMGPGIHERPDQEAERILLNSYEFFIGSKVYCPVALHHQLITNPYYSVRFMCLLREHKPIFIGSENNDQNIISDLLDSKLFIKASHVNNYASVDDIESKVLLEIERNSLDYEVIVFSCGVSAKALINRLYRRVERPVFLFDLGSVVDLFHGRTSWTWVKKSGRDDDYISALLQKIKE